MTDPIDTLNPEPPDPRFAPGGSTASYQPIHSAAQLAEVVHDGVVTSSPPVDQPWWPGLDQRLEDMRNGIIGESETP